jgi:TatD DNase family protein
MHAFSADKTAASMAIRAGFYIGVAGPITYPKAEDRRELVAGLPMDRLLIETDSPALSPQPFRGRRNEPSRVRIIAQTLAEIRQLSFERTAETTSENAATLFSWEHGTNNSHIL